VGSVVQTVAYSYDYQILADERVDSPATPDTILWPLTDHHAQRDHVEQVNLILAAKRVLLHANQGFECKDLNVVRRAPSAPKFVTRDRELNHPSPFWLLRSSAVRSP
jgi:hypothetical protein